MAIPANLRRQVVKRATNCCEYCGLAQTGQEATFHVDHVVPVVAGGQSTAGKSRAGLCLMFTEKRCSFGYSRSAYRRANRIISSAPRRMAAAFPLGRRESGGYHTNRAHNGRGASHEPSAGLGNPGGGSATGQTPAPNISIRTLLSRLRGQQSVLMPRILDEVIKNFATYDWQPWISSSYAILD